MAQRFRHSAITAAALIGLLGACGSGGAPPAATVGGAPALAGHLAYSSERSGGYRIYVMNPDGSDAHRVGKKTGAFEPAWSPDGTRIAYMLNRDEGPEGGLYVMNADGSGNTQLACCSDGGLSWSPDGAAIAYRALPGSGMPAGIAIWRQSGLQSLTDEVAYDAWPTWSPDGTRIAYLAAGYGIHEFDLWLTNADGSGTPVLLRKGANNPAWSPDGTKIAFEATVQSNTDIYVMDPDGSNVVRLTEDPELDVNPTWSPDGTHLAFGSKRDGNQEIYVMKADGSEQTRITKHSGADLMPSWGP